MSSSLGANIPRNLICALLFSTLIYTLVTLSIGVALAQETGSVEVSVNGYDGRSVLTAALVDSNRSVLENKTVNSPSFSFSNLAVGKQYTVILKYKGIDYTTPVVVVNQTSRKVAIKVSDVTNSDDNLMVSLYQMAIDRGVNYLNVTEYIRFTNNGSSVIDNASIKIAMPAGYRNFIWDQDCCFKAADFGFFFTPTEPLLPNATKSVNFAYRLEPTTDEYKLSKQFYYETGDVYVLMNPNDKLTVTDHKNLWEQGQVPDNGGSLNVWGASSFYKGEDVSITITGYKGGSELNIVWIGTGVLAAVIVGAVVYGFKGNRGSVEKLESEEQALTSVLKQIDKDYAAKKMEEVEYYKLRLKYKERLDKVRRKIQQQPRKETSKSKKSPRKTPKGTK